MVVVVVVVVVVEDHVLWGGYCVVDGYEGMYVARVEISHSMPEGESRLFAPGIPSRAEFTLPESALLVTLFLVFFYQNRIRRQAQHTIRARTG